MLSLKIQNGRCAGREVIINRSMLARVQFHVVHLGIPSAQPELSHRCQAQRMRSADTPDVSIQGAIRRKDRQSPGGFRGRWAFQSNPEGPCRRIPPRPPRLVPDQAGRPRSAGRQSCRRRAHNNRRAFIFLFDDFCDVGRQIVHIQGVHRSLAASDTPGLRPKHPEILQRPAWPRQPRSLRLSGPAKAAVRSRDLSPVTVPRYRHCLARRGAARLSTDPPREPGMRQRWRP